MLSSGIPWNMPRVTCIFRVHTSLLGSCVYKENTSDNWHVPRTVSNEKALHNYFIPCLNLTEILARARKSPRFSKNFGNASNPFSRGFGKLRKQFRSVFQVIYDFLKSSENLRKSLEVFGNLWKFSENFGNGSKILFRCFYDFLKFSEGLRKSWETISRCDRKCS